MEYLIKNLIDKLISKRELELNLIEKFKNDELKDLILISSGKIIELDSILQKLRELLEYYNTTK